MPDRRLPRLRPPLRGTLPFGRVRADVA